MMESLKRILIGPGDAATEWRTLGQTRVIVALLLVSIAATVWVTAIGSQFKSYDEVAGTESPKSLRELTLVPNGNRAEEILTAWRKAPELLNAVRFNLAVDNRFVFAYTIMFLCWASFACRWAYCWTSKDTAAVKFKWARFHWTAIIVAAGMLAGADLRENYCIEQIINGSNACTIGSLRLFSQLKFIMLALVDLILLLALGIGTRRECHYRKGPQRQPDDDGKSDLSGGLFDRAKTFPELQSLLI